MKPNQLFPHAWFAALMLACGSPVSHAMPDRFGLTPTAPLARVEPGSMQRPLRNVFALPAGSRALPIRLAHAILVKANPEKEAVISDVPSEVLLIFNDGVGEEFLALAVVDESGKRVDKHDARLDFTDHSHLRTSVESLAPGRYMVRYRVLSADGHVVSGKYFFQVQGKQ